MSTYAEIAHLPLRIEDYSLEGLTLELPAFTRRTTVVHLRGGGEEGIGEDVTYDAEAQVALQETHASGLPLAGEHTLDSFSQQLAGLDLFPGGTPFEVYRSYRRWAFESAALDLALRQAGRSLGQALGRELRPVTYVVSTRATDLAPLLELYPALRFKLDPTPEWTDELIARLAALDAVDGVDHPDAAVDHDRVRRPLHRVVLDPAEPVLELVAEAHAGSIVARCRPTRRSPGSRSGSRATRSRG